jgi:hypothetical protein
MRPYGSVMLTTWHLYQRKLAGTSPTIGYRSLGIDRRTLGFVRLSPPPPPQSRRDSVPVLCVFVTGLCSGCNFVTWALQLVCECAMAANKISPACRHCQREGNFIGKPLFQLVKRLGGHRLSLKQTRVRQPAVPALQRATLRSALVVALSLQEL